MEASDLMSAFHPFLPRQFPTLPDTGISTARRARWVADQTSPPQRIASCLLALGCWVLELPGD